jgi:hypothetical protein
VEAILPKVLELHMDVLARLRKNLLFRPDDISDQLWVSGGGLVDWHDCLGRSSAQQAFDAISDYKKKGTARLDIPCPDNLVNHQDILGRSLLHMACECGSPEYIQELLAAGADRSLKTIYGSLPIHFAAASGSLGLCQMLIHMSLEPIFHAPINESDSQGNTALYYVRTSLT